MRRRGRARSGTSPASTRRTRCRRMPNSTLIPLPAQHNLSPSYWYGASSAHSYRRSTTSRPKPTIYVEQLPMNLSKTDITNPPTFADADIQGHLDAVHAGCATGWISSSAHPGLTLEVEVLADDAVVAREMAGSEEHTSELQSLMSI